MASKKKGRELLAIKNPNRAWVAAELEKLWREWEAWGEYAQTIEDHPYDRNTQAECFADGVANMEKHDILREKTLTFLDNNIQGHNFMHSNEYDKPYENELLRLRQKVPQRLKELKILRASLEYATVPDGFWKEQGKALVSRIANKAPDAAADIATRFLRNPMNGG